MDVEDRLRELGLKEGEVSVYIACLKVGSAKVDAIARLSRRIRTTTYSILKSLREKGFVSSVMKGRAQYFEALPPREILAMLEERKAKFKSVLSELESLEKSAGEKPRVRVYEGKDGLRAVFGDILTSKTPCSGFSSAKFFDVLTFYAPQFIKERAARGIAARIIQEKTKFMEDLATRDREDIRDMRFMPEDLNMRDAFYVYEDKTALFTFRHDEPMAMIIKDADIADLHKKLFDFVWKYSEIPARRKRKK